MANKDPMVAFVESNLPVEAPVQTPEIKVETPSVEVNNKVETPAASPKPEKVETTAEGIVDLEISEIPAVKTEGFDFNSFIKDVGFDVKNPEEFKVKIKEVMSKEDPLKGLPDNVRKAVEFAKQGGDIFQMLKVSQVDYSQMDDTIIYENYIHSTVSDKAKAQEYLDSLSPLAKEVEGRKLKNQYVQWQQEQERQLKSDLDAKAGAEIVRRKENETRLREALDKVQDISGFKVHGSYKNKFFDDVTNSRLSQRLFFNEKGEYDYDKMFKVAFIYENFDKIQNYYKDRVKNSTLREVIQERVNATVEKPTEKPTITDQPDSPFDSWMNSSKGIK